MYTSYGLTQAILQAVYEGDQTDLIRIIESADPEVLADEIFQMVGTLILQHSPEKRQELEARLFSESTRYDFETLVQNLSDRFIFPKCERPEGT